MNSTVTDLAKVLSDQMAGGSGSARAVFGSKSNAFSYLSGNLNSTIAHVQAGVSESRTFSSLHVEPTAEEVGPWVDADGPKPITAQIKSQTTQLATYPGAASIKTADLLDSNGIGAAVNVALYQQAVRALDKALIVALLDTWGIEQAADLATIAQAQALLMAAGFTPALCVVSPTLYGALAGSSLLQGGNNPQDPQVSILGSRLLVSSSLTGSSAIVLDPASVVAIEHEASPVAITETRARDNRVDIVLEIVAGFVVVQEDGIIPISAA